MSIYDSTHLPEIVTLPEIIPEINLYLFPLIVRRKKTGVLEMLFDSGPLGREAFRQVKVWAETETEHKIKKARSDGD